MQKIRISILLTAIVAFSSCQFNQSVNTDLSTGAYSRGDGIGSDDVIIEINGKAEKRNEFIFGENVNLIFNNVSGLTTSDNKTYPQLAMHIIKNEKDTLLSNPNLLKNLEDGTNLNPMHLNASFTTAISFDTTDQYKVYVKISDKKGDGQFAYELPFMIKENDLLTIENQGFEYSRIYLWNDTLKQYVVTKNINSDDFFILILDGIEGMQLKDEKVFPIFSLNLMDSNGNKIISNPNLLSDFETIGINPDDLKKQLVAKITLTKGKVVNPCSLVAILKDKNSAKEITIKTELIIN